MALGSKPDPRRQKGDQQAPARDFIAAGASPFAGDDKTREAMQQYVQSMQSSGKADYEALYEAYRQSQVVGAAQGSPLNSFFQRFTAETLQLALRDPRQRRAFFEELIRAQAEVPLDESEVQKQAEYLTQMFDVPRVQRKLNGCLLMAGLFVFGTIGVMLFEAALSGIAVGLGITADSVEHALAGSPLAQRILIGIVISFSAVSIAMGFIYWLRRKLSSVLGVVSLIITLVLLGFVVIFLVEAGIFYLVMDYVQNMEQLSGGFR
jgi:hypothetical protein